MPNERARASAGEASSTVFLFDGDRHIAIEIFADGSGGISTYQNKRLRSSVSVPSFTEWRVLYDAIGERINMQRAR